MSEPSWLAVIEEEKLVDNRPHMACRLTAGRLFGHVIRCACHD